jgi:hypothetical protein
MQGTGKAWHPDPLLNAAMQELSFQTVLGKIPERRWSRQHFYAPILFMLPPKNLERKVFGLLKMLLWTEYQNPLYERNPLIKFF